MDYNLILLSTTLAINISKELSSDELSLFAAFLVSLADNLALLATQKGQQESLNG